MLKALPVNAAAPPPAAVPVPTVATANVANVAPPVDVVVPAAEAKVEKKICLNDMFITADDEAKACKAEVLGTIPSDIRDVVPLIMQYLQFRFEKGTSLDVLDTVSKWYESEIKEIRDDKVLVHYKGWPETWDEWIEKKSARFAPANYYSTRGFVARNSPQEPQIDETEKNRRIALLVGIGFPMEQVTAALTRYHWNLEQAASSLVH